jgi:hypothetical protein
MEQINKRQWVRKCELAQKLMVSRHVIGNWCRRGHLRTIISPTTGNLLVENINERPTTPHVQKVKVKVKKDNQRKGIQRKDTIIYIVPMRKSVFSEAEARAYIDKLKNM